MTTHAFSDLLADLTTGARGAIPPRARTCCRCERLADESRKRAGPELPVASVETWMVEGVRYFGGLCRDCTDWEWSWRWNARYDAARSSTEKLLVLERERQDWIAKGREFRAQARKAA